MHLNFLFWIKSKRRVAESAEDFAEGNEGNVFRIEMILPLIQFQTQKSQRFPLRPLRLCVSLKSFSSP